MRSIEQVIVVSDKQNNGAVNLPHSFGDSDEN